MPEGISGNKGSNFGAKRIPEVDSVNKKGFAGWREIAMKAKHSIPRKAWEA